MSDPTPPPVGGTYPPGHHLVVDCATGQVHVVEEAAGADELAQHLTDSADQRLAAIAQAKAEAEAVELAAGATGAPAFHVERLAALQRIAAAAATDPLIADLTLVLNMPINQLPPPEAIPPASS